MGFDDALKNSLEKSKTSKCSVYELSKEMSDADSESFMSAVMNRKVPIMAIYRALKDLGLSASRDKIRNHREGSCECRSMSH